MGSIKCLLFFLLRKDNSLKVFGELVINLVYIFEDKLIKLILEKENLLKVGLSND